MTIKDLFGFDSKDIDILELIKENKFSGTLDFSKKIGLAPKNLINRLKKIESLNLITKKSKSYKPSGYIRVYELTKKGEFYLSLYLQILKKIWDIQNLTLLNQKMFNQKEIIKPNLDLL